MQTKQYEKLKDILREMFQMDQADLDFGIYRIMNAKRDEIEKFLDKELLPQVKEEFAKYRGTEIEDKKKELSRLEATLRDRWMNPMKPRRSWYCVKRLSNTETMRRWQMKFFRIFRPFSGGITMVVIL